MMIRMNELSAADFLTLFRSVGWEAPCIEQIETALANSLAAFAVFDEGRPIAMARLIGDGGMSYYIKDFAVMPAYQGQGVGRMLMEQMEAYIKSSLKEGWAVSLELISAKGREAFYEKFGFEQRPCAWDGAGMFKMIRK